MVTRRIIVIFLIVYSFTQLVTCHDETNNDNLGNTDTNKNRLSESTIIDRSEKDSPDVYNDDNVNSQNLNTNSNTEHKEYIKQIPEEEGVTNEPENDNQGTQTGADSETSIETDRQHVEQEDKEEQEGHALNIETIEEDDDGIHTEPFFPGQHNKYEEHLESRELNEQHAESNIDMANTESQQGNGNLATEQLKDNENIEKSEQEELSSDKNSGKNEEFYDVHIQQESEQSETDQEVVMELQKDNENQVEEEKGSRISDHDVKETGKHMEDINVGETSEGNDQLRENSNPSTERITTQDDTSGNADRPENKIDEGHMHTSEHVRADITLEKLDSYIQDTLSEVVKELDDSGIPRENDLGREQIVADFERRNMKQDGASSEVHHEEAGQDKNLEKEETMNSDAGREGVSSEPAVTEGNVPQEEQTKEEETIEDTKGQSKNLELQEDSVPEKTEIDIEEFVVINANQKDEPESSNVPGTRFSEEEELNQDILKEASDSPSQEQTSSTEEQHMSSNEQHTSSEEQRSSNEEENNPSSSEGISSSQHEEGKKNDMGQELYEEAMALLNNSQTKTDPRILSLLERAAYEHLHKKSQEHLGLIYMFGDSVAQNFTKAFELFEMAANGGSPKAQQMLGFMYASGINVNSSQSKALVYLTFSALGGNTMAEIMLGYRYFAGVTVQENCETALTYYRRVSSKVVADVSVIGGPAVQRIRLSDEGDENSQNAMLDEDLIQYYQFLADKGDVQAQVGLGQLHYQGGRGVEQDFARAHHYFQLAAEAGNANAYAFLGKLYSSGNSAVKANNETALKYFKKAAEKGNPVGQSGVGLMYLFGKGVEKDYALAIEYFKLAADQGWVDGQLQLGTMYYHGLGIRRDYQQALKYFNLASQSGNIQAIYNLGTMYSSGTGIIRSCRTATELFKNVAERGRWSSMLMDAHKAYKSGYTNQALLKYAYLAELGYETAQSNVAFILDQEQNTVMSDNYTYPRALLYWTRAAEQGNVRARVKVGDYYFYGQGTNVNYETAAFHYDVAHEQHGSAQAKFNLGYMYERGLGRKRDFHLAKRYYDMAAEASPDAQAPVTLALLKLAVIYGIDWFNNNYDFWSHLQLNVDEHLGKDWDIYVMTILALLVGLLILLRWR